MQLYQENYCRICSEFFCCKKCRLEHEVNNHGIHPECNICIYGRAFFTKPSESLLQHFKLTHLPLHCLFCKMVFTAIQDLVLHSKCTMAQKVSDPENSNIFMIASTTIEENYDSPPITTTMHKSILTSSNKYYNDYHDRVWLTTSTPMQNFNERESLQRIPEVITPVDYSEKNNYERLQSINASSVNSVTSEQSKDADPPLKRRVTFSEIEIINIETPYQNRKTKYIPSYEIKSEIKQEESFHNVSEPVKVNRYFKNEINDNGCKSEMVQEEGVTDTPKQNTFDNYMNLTQPTHNDTEWETALMEAVEIPEDKILTESINSTKSEIWSPVLSENLEESPIINSISSPVENKNLIIVVNQNIMTPENFYSQIQDHNLGSSSVEQNLIKISNPSKTEIDQNLKESSLENDEKSSNDLESATTSGEASGIKPSQKLGIWSSMANIFKSVVQGLSSSTHNNDNTEKNKQRNSFKRSKPEVDTSVSESPIRKKIKLTHIQCRRTIRTVRPFYELQYGGKNVQTNESWTQTD